VYTRKTLSKMLPTERKLALLYNHLDLTAHRIDRLLPQIHNMELDALYEKKRYLNLIKQQAFNDLMDNSDFDD
jgi:hypothetical protein